MEELQFDFLANRKNHINLVADWMFSEWGHLVPDRSYEDLCNQIQSKVNTKSLPLHIVAIKGDQTIGVAVIKRQEMKIYPKDSYWLGSLVVDKPYRGNGGLYKKLGWSEIEITEDRGDSVLVMEKIL